MKPPAPRARKMTDCTSVRYWMGVDENASAQNDHPHGEHEHVDDEHHERGPCAACQACRP